MSLTLATARTELRARGGEFLYDGTTTRLDYYLNRAMQELCGEEDWDFLKTASSGIPPVTIADLRSVEYVIEQTTNTKLRPLARAAITDSIDADLSTAGTPWLYYLNPPGNIVQTYPTTTTDTIAVHYIKVPADLTAGTDVPPFPARFHMGWIDGAMAFAYLDSDNFASAQQLLAVFEGVKEQMREQLLDPTDRPNDYVILDPSWSY